MNRILSGGLALFFLGAVLSAIATRPAASLADDGKVEELMRGKLENAKQLLEGLAMQDFTQIEKNAHQLSLLSTETDWQVLQTPEYRQLSAEFRDLANGMRTSAQQKNLDGATLGYVGLTLKCVQCHKYVRGVQAGEN